MDLPAQFFRMPGKEAKSKAVELAKLLQEYLKEIAWNIDSGGKDGTQHQEAFEKRCQELGLNPSQTLEVYRTLVRIGNDDELRFILNYGLEVIGKLVMMFFVRWVANAIEKQ